MTDDPIECDNCHNDIDPDEHRIRIKPDGNHDDLCLECQTKVPHEELYRPATDGGTDTRHVALCSGGKDSTAATHAAMRFGPCELVVYLDTGTGAPENLEYIRRLCDRFDWPLRVMETPESYEDLVVENGFPGPSRHFIMYQRLKERQLCQLAAETDRELHLWTGIRRHESDRRMRHVEPESERGNGRWFWRAPLCDWHDREPERYISRFRLPRNPLWDTLGRSGDCFCGCFGSPEELLDLRAIGSDDLADDIRELEELAQSAGHADEKSRWAWGGMTGVEQRAERADGRDMTLCSSCGVDYPIADGGTADSEVSDE